MRTPDTGLVLEALCDHSLGAGTSVELLLRWLGSGWSTIRANAALAKLRGQGLVARDLRRVLIEGGTCDAMTWSEKKVPRYWPTKAGIALRAEMRKTKAAAA